YLFEKGTQLRHTDLGVGTVEYTACEGIEGSHDTPYAVALRGQLGQGLMAAIAALLMPGKADLGLPITGGLIRVQHADLLGLRAGQGQGVCNGPHFGLVVRIGTADMLTTSFPANAPTPKTPIHPTEGGQTLQ